MADFSQFAAPSLEWQELVKAGGVTAPPKVDAKELRKATNSTRDSAAIIAMEALQDKATAQDVEIPTSGEESIPARIYRPTVPGKAGLLPVYLHFHGGGFLFGTVSSEDPGCTRIAAALPMVVVNACYRHTPEAKFPAAHDDAWNAFTWTVENIRAFGGDPGKIVVGGVSAGGNLAASVVLRHGKHPPGTPQIRGQLLCIPWLLHPEAFPHELLASRGVSSPQTMEFAPILPKTTIDLFTSLLEIKDPFDPLFNVGLATDEEVSKVPRAAFLIAGMDQLRDEGLLYAQKLQRNGVPVNVHIFPGVPHGFSRFPNLQAAKRYNEVVVESIRWILEERPSVAEFQVEG